MIEEDFQCWQEYKTQRWVFNKLEVAMKLGYDCGPAGVPITKDGYYIVRPIYNLYGMGIGAKKKYLSLKDDSEDMIHHKHIPPSYFWCEWFSGKHHSVDFKKQNGRWVAFNEVVGYHYNDDKIMRDWKKNRSFMITNSGYDAYFGISSTALAQDAEFDVDEGATKAKIKTAFVKSLKTKKLNKKVLGEFMELVA